MDQKRESADYDVYLVGRYFTDLIFTQLPEIPHLGHEVYARGFHLAVGGVATPAIALTRLGLRVAWHCQFGSDPFSYFVKEQVLHEGVDSTFFTETNTPSLRISVAFSFEEERAFLSYIDEIPELAHQDYIRHSKPAWIYITNLHMGNELNAPVMAGREVGARIFMDCQAHHSSIKDPIIQEALRWVDVFSPNAQEARILTGEKSVENALNMLADFTDTVVIKLGAEGCICQQGLKSFHVPGIQTRVLDTTGAGDNFNCGFLFGQVKGYSLHDCLRIANICGGMSVQGYGGASTSPTYQQVVSMLKNYSR